MPWAIRDETARELVICSSDESGKRNCKSVLELRTGSHHVYMIRSFPTVVCRYSSIKGEHPHHKAWKKQTKRNGCAAATAATAARAASSLCKGFGMKNP